jgi:thymidylate synthase
MCASCFNPVKQKAQEAANQAASDAKDAADAEAYKNKMAREAAEDQVEAIKRLRSEIEEINAEIERKYQGDLDAINTEKKRNQEILDKTNEIAEAERQLKDELNKCKI